MELGKTHEPVYHGLDQLIDLGGTAFCLLLTQPLLSSDSYFLLVYAPGTVYNKCSADSDNSRQLGCETRGIGPFSRLYIQP